MFARIDIGMVARIVQANCTDMELVDDASWES